MDFVRSHFGIHLSEVTSYKIHTLVIGTHSVLNSSPGTKEKKIFVVLEVMTTRKIASEISRTHPTIPVLTT